jgi:hypothetical protein
MKNLFHDILDMDGVHGLVLLSEEGSVLFESFESGQFSPQRSKMSLKAILASLGDCREMSLLLEKGRCYLRRTENGFLIVSMEGKASVAMIKLSCDIILPQLKKVKTGGFRSFFRR